MNLADFLHADCNAIIFVRLRSHSISLTFKRQSTGVVLVGPPVVAGRGPMK